MNKTRSFEHTPKSVAAARRFAAELLAGTADRDALDAIQLMVSELATNCIRHTDSGFNPTIIRDSGRIRVEASDRGAGEPRKQSPGPTDPSGRGLQIVDVLSTDWGCDHRPDVGKTVWFTIDFRAGLPARDAGAHRLEAQDRRQARAYDTEADFGQVALSGVAGHLTSRRSSGDAMVRADKELLKAYVRVANALQRPPVGSNVELVGDDDSRPRSNSFTS